MLYPCGVHDSDLMPGGQGDPCDFPRADLTPSPDEPDPAPADPSAVPDEGTPS